MRFLFAVVFVPEFGALKGIAYAIFHSVSAFCNAGIDILGDGSFTQYVRNPVINLTTMMLIIAGGIGFTVWNDLIGNFKKVKAKKLVWSKVFYQIISSFEAGDYDDSFADYNRNRVCVCIGI